MCYPLIEGNAIKVRRENAQSERGIVGSWVGREEGMAERDHQVPIDLQQGWVFINAFPCFITLRKQGRGNQITNREHYK